MSTASGFFAGFVTSGGLRFFLSQRLEIPAKDALLFNVLDMSISTFSSDLFQSAGSWNPPNKGQLLAGRIVGLLATSLLYTATVGQSQVFTKMLISATAQAAGQFVATRVDGGCEIYII